MTTTKQTIKAGTRIEFPGTPAIGTWPAVPLEQATIARWTKVSGERKNHIREHPGWHVVKFADGGMLCAHESGFRVIENRVG